LANTNAVTCTDQGKLSQMIAGANMKSSYKLGFTKLKATGELP
jgi:hypothetical protein